MNLSVHERSIATPRTILVVDDELPVRRVLARALAGPARRIVSVCGGTEALAMAEERAPDLILLDVSMPGKSGWEVLEELRRRPATRMIPVIMVTSLGANEQKMEGFALDADDYVTKPFSVPVLVARVEGLLRRHALLLTANPLTRLPGNSAIEAEGARRLSSKTPFAFFYIDIDRFKAFNDARGFAEGDRLLLETAALIRECFGKNFAGHIGGDDFVAFSGLEEAPHVANRLAMLFDESAARFAGPALRPPTLSISVVTTDRRDFPTFAGMAAVAAELKSYLKSETGRTLSRFTFDRRSRMRENP